MEIQEKEKLKKEKMSNILSKFDRIKNTVINLKRVNIFLFIYI